MTDLKADSEELIHGNNWTNITGSIEYTFLNPSYLPSYWTDLFGGLEGWLDSHFEDNISEVTGLSVDQRKITHYFMASHATLVGTGGTNEKGIDDNLFVTIHNGTAGTNYRVSFSDVANITFTEKTHLSSTPNDVGEIAIGQATQLDPATLARGFYPGTTNGGDVVLGSVDNDSGLDGDLTTDFDPGEQGSWLILHELGHSVGLKDAVDIYTGGQEYLNNQKYTVMSYERHHGIDLINPDSFFVRPTSLQLLDIWALQDIYGANTNLRSGDTTYALGKGFGFFDDPSNLPANAEDQPFMYTIWDGGGNDTIDASAFDVGAEIDLREGRFSSIGKTSDGFAWSLDATATSSDPDPGNVAIAYGTEIENAVGTDYSDFIYGNDLDNIIIGGAGNDHLYGGAGADTADYSLDMIGGIPGTITATLKVDGTATVLDGWGDTDTLTGMEIITASAGTNDTIDFENRAALERIYAKDDGSYIATIDTGAGDVSTKLEGFEHVTLFTEGNDYVEMDIGFAENFTMFDGLGGSDTLVFDHYNVVYDEAEGQVYKIQSGAYDGYSQINIDNFEHVEAREIIRDAAKPMPENNNLDRVQYNYQKSKTGLIFNINDNTDPQETIGSVTGGGFNDHIELRSFTGSNYGDTIYAGYGYQYSNEVDAITTGIGDDTVIFEELVKSYSSSYSASYDGTTQINYTGGDDVYYTNGNVSRVNVVNGYLASDIVDYSFTTIDSDHFNISIDFDNGQDKTGSLDITGTTAMYYGAGAFSLFYVGFPDDTIFITRDGNGFVDSYLDDNIVDSHHASIFKGTFGDDSVFIPAGNDAQRYYALDGNDFITDVTVNDTMFYYGGDGSDRINAPNDVYGGNGADILDNGKRSYGDDGNDIIYISANADEATGGADADIFVIKESEVLDVTVTDFNALEDRLDLRNLEFIKNLSDLDTYSYQSGSSLIIDDYDDFSIELQNITLADLTSQNVIFRTPYDPGTPPPTDPVYPSMPTATISDTAGTDHVSLYDNNLENVPHIMQGLAGDDYLEGGSGDDYLYGGDGDDELFGGEGNDVLYTGNSSSGYEYLYGWGGDDILIIDSDNTELYVNASGGDGLDYLVLPDTYATSDLSVYDYDEYGYINILGYKNGSEIDVYIDTYVDTPEDPPNKIEYVVVQDVVYDLYWVIDNGWTQNPNYEFTPDPNNIPTAANDDVFGTDSDILYGNIFADNGHGLDYDPNGIELLSVAQQTFVADMGVFELSTDGNFTFTPDQAISKDSATISYTLEDPEGNQNTADVHIQLTGTDDYFASTSGYEQFYGGLGSDTVSYENATASVSIGLDYGWTYGEGNDTLYSIENIIGGDYDDYFGLTGENNTVEGGSGNDLVGYEASLVGIEANLSSGLVDEGRDGIWNDTLISIEDLIGTYHNDKIIGNLAVNNLSGEAGNDEIYGLAGNDTLRGRAGNDILDGGDGLDTATYSYSGNGIIADLSMGEAFNDGYDGIDTLISIENVTGSAHNDHITGDASDNVLSGNAGDDILIGGAGNDTAIYSGAFADYLVTDIGGNQYTLADQRSGTNDGTDTVSDIENFQFSDGTYLLSEMLPQLNNDPNAQDDIVSGDEDSQITGNVLSDNGNGADSDVDLDTLSVVAETITTAQGGSVILLANGDFIYTPATNFNGSDSFSYTLQDGNGGSDTGLVTLNVNPIDDAPVLSNNGAATDENVSFTVTTAMLSLSDVDTAASNRSFTLQSAPSQGTLQLNGVALAVAAVFTQQDIIDGLISYTPDANANGTDSFDVIPSDGTTDLGTETFSITVASVNDAPAGTNDAVTTDEDSAVTIDVLANDSDVDLDILSVDGVTQGANGSVSINPDDTLTYTPNANFNGVDSFTYIVSDNNGGNASVTVDVSVNAVNDAPVIENSAGSVDEDGVLSITASMLDVSDLDNTAAEIVFTIESLAMNGTLYRDSIALSANDTFTQQDVIDGVLNFEPDADAFGEMSFDYSVSDGTAILSAQSFEITVNAVNDVPVAVSDSFSGDEDTAITGNVLANDSDIDGDTLSVVAGIYTTAQGGSVDLAANGDFTYTPSAGYFGTDNFDYTIEDGNGGSDTGTVSLTINEVTAPATDGTSGNDLLEGGTGDDVLNGYAGDDILAGGAGNDTIYGGAGNDEYVYSSGLDTIEDTGDNDTLSFAPGIEASDINFIDTGSENVTLVLNSGTDAIEIVGQRGSDSSKYIETLQFANGSTIDFADYKNWTFGTSGSDTSYEFSQGQVVYGGEGADTIFGFGGSHTLIGGAGDDHVVTSSSGNHKLFGGDGNDTLSTDDSSDDDWLEGGAGNDQMYAWAGNDTLIGGEGNDMYYYRDGDGQDTIIDSSGSDSLMLAESIGNFDLEDLIFENTDNFDVTITISTSPGDSILVQDQRNENGTGQVEELVLGWSDDDFSLNFGEYNNWAIGTSNNETLIGNNAQNDTILGRAGDDIISGLSGHDELIGDAGADTLYGGDGDDTLYAGSGNDFLYGEKGLDTLYGGTGADTFFFMADDLDSEVDTISDFDTFEGDAIDIADLLSLYDPLADTLADFVEITDNGTDSFLSVDVNGEGDSFVQILEMTGVTGLTDEAALVANGNLIV